MGKLKQKYQELGASEELAEDLEQMRIESMDLNSTCLALEDVIKKQDAEIAQLNFALECFKKSVDGLGE